jgi:hypothetical protein
MYHLISVERSDAPDGAEGGKWCRYVIGQGNSRIVGHRLGSVQQVTQHAKTCVEELNARAKWPVSATWTATKKKTKK